MLVLAFGLLQWAAGLQPANAPGNLLNDLYFSAITLFTVGTAEPSNMSSKWLTALEGGLGIGFFGLIIGYLPVLYQSFSTRELRISLLDARAGSPPSASGLLRNGAHGKDGWSRELGFWEQWMGQVLENQISFPMLAHFRSQHSNQSWLTALIAMTDAAAVMTLCSRDEMRSQAELAFAMGRHTIDDLSTVYRLHPIAKGDRLPTADFERLVRAVAPVSRNLDIERLPESALRDMRRTYEPQALALSEYFLMAVPPWIADENVREDWRVNAADRYRIPFAVSDPFSRDSES
jgi:hypothetical protein